MKLWSILLGLAVTMARMVALGARIIALRGGILVGSFWSFAAPCAITAGLLATALLAVFTLTVSLLGVPELPGPFCPSAMIAAVTLQRINR